MPANELAKQRLAALTKRHSAWLDHLGLLHKPWLVLGSAPEPTLPPELVSTHVRVDINNAGRTAAALGLGRADLTLRAKHKSWEEHPHLDTRGLLWVHTWPSALLRLLLIGKPYGYIGSVVSLKRDERHAIVTHVTGASVSGIGDLGKVSNGVAAICYALLLDVPQIVVAGMSLSKAGHSYDQLQRERRQVDEDTFILGLLKHQDRLWTSEPNLATDAGLRLWMGPN